MFILILNVLNGLKGSNFVIMVKNKNVHLGPHANIYII